MITQPPCKYWGYTALNEAGDYTHYCYKWDELYDSFPVALGPEPWCPAPVSSKYSCSVTDRLLDQVDGLTASIKHEDLSPIIHVLTWDPDCRANISIYRTKRSIRVRKAVAALAP